MVLSSRVPAVLEPQAPPTPFPTAALGPHPGGKASRTARAPRARTVALCFALQLVAVLGVYAAHERWVAPRVEAASAARRSTQRALLEPQAGTLLAPADTGRPADCPRHCQQAGARGAVAPGAGALAPEAAAPAASAANCTVRLDEANLALLEREIRAISQSLADPRPWLQGAADAQLTDEKEGRMRRGGKLQVKGAIVPRLVDQLQGPHNTANVPGGPVEGAAPLLLWHDKRRVVPTALPSGPSLAPGRPQVCACMAALASPLGHTREELWLGWPMFC